MNYSSDSLSVYLDEIAQYRLLTAAEEADLAHRISMGDDFAKELLINSNLRLVVMCAKKFAKDPDSLLDYIQEGNFGLIHAADSFDPAKGRFSTYASKCIENCLLKAYGNSKKSVQASVELDSLVFDDESPLAEYIQDVNAVDPAEELELLDDQRLTEKMLDMLDDKEAESVKFFYGFYDEAGLTAKDVAAKNNMKPTELDKYMAKGMRKLRAEYKDYDRAA